MMNIRFPSHISLSLEHNPHKSEYMTIQEYFEVFCKNEDSDDDVFDLRWISKESYIKACEKDDFWVLTWFPDTPAGACVLYADNLQDLIIEANQGFPDEAKE